ncbi:TPA: transferrin-binding protein-like solute binding protein [Neisseria gonorrhoeae]
MNKPLVNQAAMVLPVFLLSACLGGGGSFDLDSVDTEAPRPAPKYHVPSKKPEARKDQGGYGFAMRFKRRNRHPMAMSKENEVKLKDDDWEATGLPGDPKDLPGRQKSVIDEVSDNGNNDIYFSPYLKPSNHQNSSINGSANQPKNEVKDYKNFEYVYSGWFYKHAKPIIDRTQNKLQQGDDGYIFYHGKDPSRQLPASEKVIYKGVWHFVTDTKQGQKFNDILETSKKQGDSYSGFSGDEGETTSNRTDSNLNDKHEGYGFTSNFEVDFNNKKLTGKLIRNNKVTDAAASNGYTTEYYTLDATLRGNRFSGTATATDKPKKKDESKLHPFVSDSSSLSGGFFGPKGEELGFRFLSDDNKVAVVGSAKTKDKNANGNTAAAGTAGAAGMSSEDTKLTTVLDAVELTPDGKKVKNLDNFSDATRLVVDGIMIPLLPTESGNGQAGKGENGKTAFTYETTYTPESYTPESDKKDTKAQTGAGGMQTASDAAGVNGGQAGTKTYYKVEACCSNLNYLKYGLLTRENSNSVMQTVRNSSQAAARTAQGAQSMFLQGERTDEKEIPKEQKVVYLGTWYGHIAANGTSWTGNASDQQSGNRAKFDVNFKDKKITGTLTAANRREATFTIDAMIESNGFKGEAKTGNDGFAPDQNSSTGTYKVHIANAEVQGGFYGPNAEELGGWFAYPGNGQTKNAQENAQASSGNGNSAGSATVVFGAKRQQLVK